MVEISPKLAIRLQRELLSTKLAFHSGVWGWLRYFNGGLYFFFSIVPRPMPDFFSAFVSGAFPTFDPWTNYKPFKHPDLCQRWKHFNRYIYNTQQCQYPRFFVNKFLLVSNCFTGIPWQWTTAGGDTPDRSYLRHSHPGLGPPPRSIPSIMYIHIYAQKIWKICLYLESCNIVWF